jgi:predicted metal-dependent phosphoesterase TrpH
VTRFADLHIHTYYSDSTSSPQEVVQEALQNKLSCIAITDHDTVDGIAPTRKVAEAVGLEVITGIELSSEIHGKDVHILGYCFHEESPLVNELVLFQEAREERIRQMIEKLKGLGVDNITFEEVSCLTKSRSVGRPHLAAVLKEKKWVHDIGQAFTKYLAEDAPAYVAKYKISPADAVELIRKSGGVAVMAHPMFTNKDEIIPSLVKAGLGGIEVYYPNCSEAVLAYYEGIARKHDLVATGGSDAHGKAKTNTYIGKKRIPYEVVEQLKERAKKDSL